MGRPTTPSNNNLSNSRLSSSFKRSEYLSRSRRTTQSGGCSYSAANTVSIRHANGLQSCWVRPIHWVAADIIIPVEPVIIANRVSLHKPA